MPVDLLDLERQLALLLVTHKVHGAAVALTTTTQTLLVAGFGKADPSTDRALQLDTPFAAGPLSPLFVALLAGRAEAREAGLLDKPLAPGEVGLGDRLGSSQITLEQLLEQTAGVDDLGPRELMPAEQFNGPLAEVMQRGGHAVAWRPGSVFLPSRPSITAAALLLEKKLGSPFAELVESELTDPLHLSCTSFRPGPALAMQMVLGVRHGQRVQLLPHQQWPAEGLVTCAQDLDQVLQILLGRGRVQTGPQAGLQVTSPGLVDRMSGGTRDLPGRLWVSGPATQPLVARGHLGAGVQGLGDGTAAELAFFPAEGVGYAVLLPVEDPQLLEQLSEVVRGYLLGRARRPVPPPRSTPVAGELDRLTGTWEPAASRNPLRHFLDRLLGLVRVSKSGDELTLSTLLGAQQRLVPMGGGALRAPEQAFASAALVPGPEGELLVTHQGTFRRAGAFGWVRLFLLGATLLLLGAAMLFALLWLPSALLGPLRGAPGLRMRAMPALAGLVLLELGLLFNKSPQPLGVPNLTTVLLALLGLVFGALALTGVLEAVRAPQGEKPLVRGFCLVASAAAVWLAGLLLSYGLLGARLWSL